ncbi:hypothetical protein D3C72_1765420 [compost metagenome]
MVDICIEQRNETQRTKTLFVLLEQHVVKARAAERRNGTPTFCDVVLVHPLQHIGNGV